MTGFYSGSRLLSPLCPLVGLTIDQLNFLVCQLVALALGYPFRTTFGPLHATPSLRNGIEIILGFSLTYFCFGQQIIHPILQSTLCYLIMKYFSRKHFHLASLLVAMGYLSVCHIYRMVYDYGGYSMDITGPLMVITQKASSLAFALHDGMEKKEENLLEDQKKQAIKEMPTVLEYYSYIFSFHNVMVGPCVFYVDYKAFIEGNDIQPRPAQATENNHTVRIPDPVPSMFPNILITIVNGAIMMFILPLVPSERIHDLAWFGNLSFLQKNLYLLVSLSITRSKYYFAWKLGELVNTSAGLGFAGYDKDGNEKWDRLNNMDIWKLETCTGIKDNINCWNKSTQIWLRRVVYDRIPFQKTLATFTVSAFWHGFYPGYYLAFFTAAIFLFASRTVRSNIRPFFKPEGDKSVGAVPFLYDSATFICTRMANVIMVTPFVTYELVPSLTAYSSIYFWLHIPALAAIFILPKLKLVKKERKTEKQEVKSTAATEDNKEKAS